MSTSVAEGKNRYHLFFTGYPPLDLLLLLNIRMRSSGCNFSLTIRFLLHVNPDMKCISSHLGLRFICSMKFVFSFIVTKESYYS